MKFSFFDLTLSFSLLSDLFLKPKRLKIFKRALEFLRLYLEAVKCFLHLLNTHRRKVLPLRVLLLEKFRNSLDSLLANAVHLVLIVNHLSRQCLNPFNTLLQLFLCIIGALSEKGDFVYFRLSFNHFHPVVLDHLCQPFLG